MPIDAALPIDAMPIDATLPIDAAPPCTVQQVQLLGNPSFDVGGGAPWVQSQFNSGFPLIADDLPGGEHTPAFGVWMGGFVRRSTACTRTSWSRSAPPR